MSLVSWSDVRSTMHDVKVMSPPELLPEELIAHFITKLNSGEVEYYRKYIYTSRDNPDKALRYRKTWWAWWRWDRIYRASGTYVAVYATPIPITALPKLI